jgi:uncharacterized membrane protein
MAMSTQLLVAGGLSIVNAVLLGVLTVIWLRNYRTFRTPLVLGLVAFAAVLLVENLVAIYFAFSMNMLYAATPAVHTFVAVLRALQFVAIAILLSVTWK